MFITQKIEAVMKLAPYNNSYWCKPSSLIKCSHYPFFSIDPFNSPERQIGQVLFPISWIRKLRFQVMK